MSGVPSGNRDGWHTHIACAAVAQLDPLMELSNKTARQLFAEIKVKPARARFGFGHKPALVHIDLQKAYTAVGEFVTAYEPDPKQLAYVNELAELARAKGLPVVWTYVAYIDSGEDCGVWGTRSSTPDSLQNIKVGSPLRRLLGGVIQDAAGCGKSVVSTKCSLVELPARAARAQRQR
jgi:hypothetical protein